MKTKHLTCGCCGIWFSKKIIRRILAKLTINIIKTDTL